MNLTIILPEKEAITKTYDKPLTAVEIANEFQDQNPYQFLICRIDGKDHRLDTLIDKDCEVKLFDIRNSSANMAYQTSLCFLYRKAVHDILGTSTKVYIWNSLNKGLFTTLKPGNFTHDDVKAISDQMHKLVEANEVFVEKDIKRDEIEELSKRMNLEKIVDNSPDLDEAKYGRLVNEEEMIYHILLPSTGYLKSFELRKYHNGILLRFPHPTLSPDKVLPYEDQKLLYDAFSEATRWNRLMEVRYASDLNKMMLTNNYKDLILLSEALHEKKIAEIAQQIFNLKKRMILIAGPSSSGKTTFAKRLIIQLRVLGLKPLYLGTDDYFLSRTMTPLLENGEKDYESLRALDTNLLAENMNDLLAGKSVDLPIYDFIKGEQIFGTKVTSIDQSQPIIMEGIHSLNPELTRNIDEEEKFKIYISPLTQLNIDAYNRVPTTDSRLLRRLVRDYKYRGYSASETIKNWPGVRLGEEKYIFPFNGEADVFFNSQCLYELSVLKKYAEPLLKEIDEKAPEYSEAVRMLEFLKFFVAMPDDSIIPNNSIMREFIGGSIIS